MLAGIMRLVEQAQRSRSRAQALADRAASWLTIVALGAGALTFVGWLAAGADAAFAVERLVTVLVIACPHALGLAVPLVIAISTTLGARNGLLVRDRRGLEEARLLTMVVFDKTGTLTLGEHRVVGVRTAGGLTEEERAPARRRRRAGLRASRRARRGDERPRARDRDPARQRIRGDPRLRGRGRCRWAAARRRWAEPPGRLSAEPAAEFVEFADTAAAQGQGVIYLLEDGRSLAAFAVADALRPGVARGYPAAA